MSIVHNILNVFLYYSLDFIKLFLVLWGIMNFQFKKSKHLLLLSGLSIVILLIAAGILLQNNQDLLNCFLTLLNIASFSFLLQSKFFKKIANILLAYISILFIDICATGILSIPLNFTLLKFADNALNHFLGNSISIILLGIIVFVLNKKKRLRLSSGLSRKIYVLLFAGAGTGIIFVGSLMVWTLPGANERFRKMMLIVTIIACIAYCVVCFMLVIISESRDNFKALLQINQKVIEAQQSYYTLVKEKQQEIRSIRHDMVNHLTCIDSLYKRNKLQDMENYIAQLIDNTETYKMFYETGNDIVDAILNDAAGKYQKDGIEISLDGFFPPDLQINPMDLCVVFANAVNNAIEAVQKINTHQNLTRNINIKISSIKDDLYIDIQNPVLERVWLSGGTPVTTKQNKKEHGFGTKNMRQVVEKYRGTLKFISEDNLFMVEIQMKNKIVY